MGPSPDADATLDAREVGPGAWAVKHEGTMGPNVDEFVPSDVE